MEKIKRTKFNVEDPFDYSNVTCSNIVSHEHVPSKLVASSAHLADKLDEIVDWINKHKEEKR